MKCQRDDLGMKCSRIGLPITTVAMIASLFQPAMALDTCNDQWVPTGKVMGAVRRYNQMLFSLKGGTESIRALNENLVREGLPIVVGFDEKLGPKKYPNRLMGEGPEGRIALVFLKTLVAKTQTGISLDKIFEVASADSAKPLKMWSVPFNATGLIGVQGDELLFKNTFRSLCAPGVAKDVWMVILPSGKYRTMEPKEAQEPKSIPSEACKAQAVFKDSAYARCWEVFDAKLGKPRFFVMQGPMT